MPEGYSYTAGIKHNVFGAGYFAEVVLYRAGRYVREWNFDGTLCNWLADRWLERKVRHVQTVYGAVIDSA